MAWNAPVSGAKNLPYFLLENPRLPQGQGESQTLSQGAPQGVPRPERSLAGASGRPDSWGLGIDGIL